MASFEVDLISDGEEMCASSVFKAGESPAASSCYSM
jgi:hypothetical protein